MNLETKITIYKFTPQLFTLTRERLVMLCVKDIESYRYNIYIKE